MTQYPEASIRRSVERCEERDGMSDQDAGAILEAHREMELRGRSAISESHHSDLLMRSVKMAREVGGLAEALENREAAEPIVRWIHREYENPETNKGYCVALRNFGRYATGGDDIPESLEWVPASYPSTYDPRPDPAKMLNWVDHVKPMIDACQNVRDEALIALSWDLGPRTSELASLKVGNISDGDIGLKVTIENGKNGSRSPIIIKSVPFVQDWLERHPGGSEDPLWCKLSSPEAISNNYIRKILREAGRRTDMDLPSKPTPTRMRKSSASYLANKNVNQAFLEDHHGWARGSKEAARYIAVFSEASDRAIAEAHGIDVEQPDDEPSMIECVRCDYLNNPERNVCRRCGQALSQEAAEDEQARERRKDYQLAQMSPDAAARFMQVVEAMEDPAVSEELARVFGE